MKKIRKAHFIGIAGKGMSALALLLKQKGWRITGSDEGSYQPISGLLKRNRINFKKKYAAKNLPGNADVIVIGKHAKLVPEENQEVRAAFVSGIPVKSLPEMLGELSAGMENTVVAGSFGKSTVSALLAWCLVKAGKSPSYFIGAVPFGFKTNSKIGAGKDFIFEGDEYPSANWDPASKFLYLRPKNLLLISAEHDHFNVFPTEKDYVKPYKKLISLLPKDGLLVYNRKGKNLADLAMRAKCETVSYGMDKRCRWHPENIRYGTITSFKLFEGNKKIADIKTKMFGAHNVENIVGACALLLTKKLLRPSELMRAVASFKGLSGRLDSKTQNSRVRVYEAYGSSYAKARSAYEAIKLRFPKKRIITVFEPHTFSWRNRNNLGWYADIFKDSAITIIWRPPKHGKNTHQQAGFSEILASARKSGGEIYGAEKKSEALKILRKSARPDDVILLMTSGGLGGLIEKIPKLMEEVFPKKS